ncbi:MAG: hypothetical protein AAFQ80_21840 [Cyanobacteria bacterium J06621_8]
MTSQIKSESLSFSQAIAFTETLISRINADELSEDEIKQIVSSILSTKNGGRGFFVAYLTNDSILADYPSRGIIEGLNISIKVSGELLVKNLAMSTAMVVAHRRNNDSSNEENSLRIVQRTGKLIQKLSSDFVQTELKKLDLAISGDSNEYQNFLERWHYDSEQKQAIQQSIFNASTHQT